MKFTSTSQEILARHFNKKYSEFIYSGELALETALCAEKIKKHDFVILPDSVCYRVLLSVVRTGATAIVIAPKNYVNLTVEDVLPIAKQYNPRAIILVHNMGIPTNIYEFKKEFNNKTILIEDSAQAWDLQYEGKAIGMFSDYVITSFGITKLLSLGIGGAIFSNTNYFKRFLDYNNKASRSSKTSHLPYVIPESFLINISSLIKNANSRVKINRRIAKLIISQLKHTDILYWRTKVGDCPSWTSFPIWIKNKKQYFKILETLNTAHITYTVPFKNNLGQIPLAKNTNVIYYNNSEKKLDQINIKCHSNSVKMIKNWIKLL